MLEQERGKQASKKKGWWWSCLRSSLQGTKRGKLPCKVVIFINSSCVKELWCLSCMLSRPDQANGSAF